MKLQIQDNELIVRLPLKQTQRDYFGEPIGKISNLVGVINRKERTFTISQLIDMDYKGKAPQEGFPYLNFIDERELKKACKLAGLDIWEY